MLDIRRIRQNPDELRSALNSRNQNTDIDAFLLQDEQRRQLLAQVEEKKALRNAISKQIGTARKTGTSDEALAKIMEQMRRNVSFSIAATASRAIS